MPELGAPADDLWQVLLDLAELPHTPWTLVGGQMVLLHALEHSRIPPQISQDGDVVADIRAEPSAIARLVAALEQRDFAVAGMSADGLAHRYEKAADPSPIRIDILAPDGLGPRSDLTTTRPGRTVQVPAGTQLLDRSELVEVTHGGRTGLLPRPSLLAAIVGKAAACGLPFNPDRHYSDLALLCALVGDPFGLAGEVTRKDRHRLRIAGRLASPDHPAWALVPLDIRSDGQTAFAVLADL